MKKLLFFLTVVLFVLFNSCGVRSSQESTLQKSDTLEVAKTLIVDKTTINTPPVYLEVTIDEPCDKQGRTNPVDIDVGTSEASIIVTTTPTGGYKIKANIDSLVQEKLKILMANDTIKKSAEITNTTITRYRTPPWAWKSVVANIILVLLLLIFLYFKIRSWIALPMGV